MNNREGVDAPSFCFIWSNSIAAPIALAVQLPNSPWS
jgi:hypothetical protein